MILLIVWVTYIETDILICNLAEKKKELTEAETTLERLEENYSNLKFINYKMDISDQLEENGAPPLECEKLISSSINLYIQLMMNN